MFNQLSGGRPRIPPGNLSKQPKPPHTPTVQNVLALYNALILRFENVIVVHAAYSLLVKSDDLVRPSEYAAFSLQVIHNFRLWLA